MRPLDNFLSSKDESKLLEKLELYVIMESIPSPWKERVFFEDDQLFYRESDEEISLIDLNDPLPGSPEWIQMENEVEEKNREILRLQQLLVELDPEILRLKEILQEKVKSKNKSMKSIAILLR